MEESERGERGRKRRDGSDAVMFSSDARILEACYNNLPNMVNGRDSFSWL